MSGASRVFSMTMATMAEDRIGITSNFVLTDAEVADLVAAGFDAAGSVRNICFFTNAFATKSQGIDIVSTFTPLALRGNTVISAVFNYTDTRVTDNRKKLLDGRRLAEYAYSLPRRRGNVGVTQRMGGLACSDGSATMAAGTTTTAATERSSTRRAA